MHSAFKGETNAKHPTDGFDFPAEARHGLGPIVPSATAAAEMAPDIRQKHMPKQGETSAKFSA